MKGRWTILMATLAALAGALDVLSTDLRHESNPIIIMFGRSVTSLLLLKSCVTILVIFAFYCGLRMLDARRNQVRPSTGPISFLGWLFFKERTSMWKLFVWGWPRDWGAVMAVALVAAGVCAVSVGFSAALMNVTKAIRSPTHLIGFYLANIICSEVFGLYAAYIFLRPRDFIEPSADI